MPIITVKVAPATPMVDLEQRVATLAADASTSILRKSLACDLGPKGITVNIVHPGSTDTEMNPADGPGAEAQRARMAIPRYGRPENIAAMVAFVAGPEGRFITGAGLALDGGVNT